MTFAQNLNQWTGYFALAGGAAATLLGLLFVSASLRLEMFRQSRFSRTRLLASFTLSLFLMAAAIAGLALAPHEQPDWLALALAMIAVSGLIAAANWMRLSLPGAVPAAPHVPDPWRARVTVAATTVTLACLLIVSRLLVIGHPDALGSLAIVEGALLALGTQAAWIMLSHAGRFPDPETSEPAP